MYGSVNQFLWSFFFCQRGFNYSLGNRTFIWQHLHNRPLLNVMYVNISLRHPFMQRVPKSCRCRLNRWCLVKAIWSLWKCQYDYNYLIIISLKVLLLMPLLLCSAYCCCFFPLTSMLQLIIISPCSHGLFCNSVPPIFLTAKAKRWLRNAFFPHIKLSHVLWFSENTSFLGLWQIEMQPFLIAASVIRFSGTLYWMIIVVLLYYCKLW